jgi:hypothetical protein
MGEAAPTRQEISSDVAADYLDSIGVSRRAVRRTETVVIINRAVELERPSSSISVEEALGQEIVAD